MILWIIFLVLHNQDLSRPEKSHNVKNADMMLTKFHILTCSKNAAKNLFILWYAWILRSTFSKPNFALNPVPWFVSLLTECETCWLKINMQCFYISSKCLWQKIWLSYTFKGSHHFSVISSKLWWNSHFKSLLFRSR